MQQHENSFVLRRHPPYLQEGLPRNPLVAPPKRNPCGRNRGQHHTKSLLDDTQCRLIFSLCSGG
eukprot:scaffold1605_cov365-Pavlova_lutheri.AAC.2